MTARTMTISVHGVPTVCVPCPGTEHQRCGEAIARPGHCPYCDRYMSEAEFTAAIAAAEAGERAA